MIFSPKDRRFIMLPISDNSISNQHVSQIASFFSQRLDSFLSPLLTRLDQLLDKRLVLTFRDLCKCIIRLRNRPNGLLLSELGGYLFSFDKAPAGTKRISNLLRSKKWDLQLIQDYLADQAQAYCQELMGDLVLLVWDESVQEKPESLQPEGLCAVRSVKARRLLRTKKGYYDPPTKSPVHVPGIRWIGAMLCGLQAPPMLAQFRWWTSRGKHTSSLMQVRLQLLQWARDRFADAVLHVFDRGYAGAQWLGLLLARQDRFVIRWPSAYKLLDINGQPKNAYKFSIGRKATSSRQIWDINRKEYHKRSLLWARCNHPQYPDQALTLIICRPGRKGRQPWYLLTNEEINNDRDAWRIVFAYARRWHIEQGFRFSKAELGMESARLMFWENRMKLLQIVALIYAFLLSLLREHFKAKIELLLRMGCHRTGKRCREVSTPLYRIRLALANLWNFYLSAPLLNSG
jgi:hypothetical protein